MIGRAVIPDEGIEPQLMTLLGQQPFGAVPWQLLLFTNDVDPDHTTTFADLVEATGGAYARVTLDPTQWQPPTVTAGMATSLWTSSPVEFSPAGSATWDVYGWAYCDAATNKLKLVYQQAASGSPIHVTAAVPLLIIASYSLMTNLC